MSFVLFGTVSQCCDATSILDGIILFNAGSFVKGIKKHIASLLEHLEQIGQEDREEKGKKGQGGNSGSVLRGFFAHAIAGIKC